MFRLHSRENESICVLDLLLELSEAVLPSRHKTHQDQVDDFIVTFIDVAIEICLAYFVKDNLLSIRQLEILLLFSILDVILARFQ